MLNLIISLQALYFFVSYHILRNIISLIIYQKKEVIFYLNSKLFLRYVDYYYIDFVYQIIINRSINVVSFIQYTPLQAQSYSLTGQLEIQNPYLSKRKRDRLAKIQHLMVYVLQSNVYIEIASRLSKYNFEHNLFIFTSMNHKVSSFVQSFLFFVSLLVLAGRKKKRERTI